MMVQQGSKILLDYTLSTEDEVLDSTEGSGSLRIEIGAAAIHPGIEKALLGRHSGESFQIVLDPSLGFGDIDQNLILRISKNKLPLEFQKLGVGDAFESSDHVGKKRLFRIAELIGNQVTLDGNHPLAGQVLYLDAKILEIS